MTNYFKQICTSIFIICHFRHIHHFFNKIYWQKVMKYSIITLYEINMLNLPNVRISFRHHALRKQQQIIIRVRCPDNYSWLLLLLAKSANGASNPVAACCLLKANASVKSKPVRQDTSAINVLSVINEALYWNSNIQNGALGE